MTAVFRSNLKFYKIYINLFIWKVLFLDCLVANCSLWKERPHYVSKCLQLFEEVITLYYSVNTPGKQFKSALFQLSTFSRCTLPITVRGGPLILKSLPFTPEGFCYVFDFVFFFVFLIRGRTN